MKVNQLKDDFTCAPWCQPFLPGLAAIGPDEEFSVTQNAEIIDSGGRVLLRPEDFADSGPGPDWYGEIGSIMWVQALVVFGYIPRPLPPERHYVEKPSYLSWVGIAERSRPDAIEPELYAPTDRYANVGLVGKIPAGWTMRRIDAENGYTHPFEAWRTTDPMEFRTCVDCGSVFEAHQDSPETRCPDCSARWHRFMNEFERCPYRHGHRSNNPCNYCGDEPVEIGNTGVFFHR